MGLTREEREDSNAHSLRRENHGDDARRIQSLRYDSNVIPLLFCFLLFFLLRRILVLFPIGRVMYSTR